MAPRCKSVGVEELNVQRNARLLLNQPQQELSLPPCVCRVPHISSRSKTFTQTEKAVFHTFKRNCTFIEHSLMRLLKISSLNTRSDCFRSPPVAVDGDLANNATLSSFHLALVDGFPHG